MNVQQQHSPNTHCMYTVRYSLLLLILSAYREGEDNKEIEWVYSVCPVCARQGRYSFLRYTWACNLEREECAICGTMFRHTKKALIILLRESGAQTNVCTWAWLARSPGIMNIVGAEHDVKSRIHV